MRILLLLLVLLPAIARPAILTVCASGCDHTTIASAISAAGATDIVQLNENITEVVSLSKNIAEITSDNGARVWDGTGSGGSHTLSIGAGLTQAFKLHNLIIDHSSMGADTIALNGRAAGQAVTFEDLIIKHSSGTGQQLFREATSGIAADEVIFNRCEFIADSGDDCITNVSNTVVDAYTIKNCILRDGLMGYDSPSTTNAHVKFYNNTVVGNATGADVNLRGDFQNNIFANNTDDVVLGANSDKADFITNAFEEQTDSGGFGSGNIFGITSNDEFADEGSNDFHLKAGAQSIDAGTVIAVVTVDYDGVSRPQGSSYDIGAYEFIPPDDFLMLDSDLARRGIQ